MGRKKGKKTQKKPVPTSGGGPKGPYDVVITTYAHDQKDDTILFHLTLGGIGEHPRDKIIFKVTQRSVRLEVKGLKGKNLLFNILKLYREVVPEKSNYIVKKDKIILVLKKAVEGQWPSTTGDQRSDLRLEWESRLRQDVNDKKNTKYLMESWVEITWQESNCFLANDACQSGDVVEHFSNILERERGIKKEFETLDDVFNFTKSQLWNFDPPLIRFHGACLLAKLKEDAAKCVPSPQKAAPNQEPDIQPQVSSSTKKATDKEISQEKGTPLKEECNPLVEPPTFEPLQMCDIILPNRKIHQLNYSYIKKIAEDIKMEGTTKYKEQDYASALHSYAEASALCPNNGAYLLNCSACLIMLNRYEEARAKAIEALKCEPSFIKGLVRLANCHIALGFPNEAIIALKKVEELDPTVNIKKELASAKELLSLIDKVDKFNSYHIKDASIYENIFRIAPASSILHLKKIECFINTSEYKMALESVDTLPKKCIENADTHCARGICAFSREERELAAEEFHASLDLDPLHSKANFYLRTLEDLNKEREKANKAFNGGRYHEAIVLYEEILNHEIISEVTKARIHCNIGLSRLKAKEISRAIDSFESATECDEDYLKPMLKIGECLMEQKKYRQTVKHYEKLTKKFPRKAHTKLLEDAQEKLSSTVKDYYKTLGVRKNASAEEIKSAYRRLAMVHHPDKSASKDKNSSEEKFKEIGEAYKVLSDPLRRERYDRGEDVNEGTFIDPFFFMFARMHRFHHPFSYGGFESHDDYFN